MKATVFKRLMTMGDLLLCVGLVDAKICLLMEDFAMNRPRLLSREDLAMQRLHQPTKEDFEIRNSF